MPRTISLKRIIILTICVSCAGLIAGYLFVTYQYHETKSDLVEKRRDISLGDHISTVKEMFGDENYFIASGQTISAFKDSPGLSKYKKTHNVYVYTIR